MAPTGFLNNLRQARTFSRNYRTSFTEGKLAMHPKYAADYIGEICTLF